MPLTTFVPPIDPSPSTSRKIAFKILQAEFGDGYSQPTPDGINHRRRSLGLSWDVLDDDQADEISEFLTERGGTEPFYYTPPRESAPTKWVCEEFTDDVQDGGFRKITATFKQSFTLSV
jgi:phage-related protein